MNIQLHFQTSHRQYYKETNLLVKLADQETLSPKEKFLYQQFRFQTVLIQFRFFHMPFPSVTSEIRESQLGEMAPGKWEYMEKSM
jgi:hypothetical protein